MRGLSYHGRLRKHWSCFAQFRQEYHAKLVLTARSRFPSRNEWDGWIAENGQLDQTSRKIRMIRKLEELGAEVLVCVARMYQ